VYFLKTAAENIHTENTKATSSLKVQTFLTPVISLISKPDVLF